MKSKPILVVAMAFLLCYVLPRADATVHFNDGGYHVIDYPIGDEVRVDFDTPDSGTHVEVVDGGSISYGLIGFNNSYMTVAGGSMGWIDTWDNSYLIVSGGSMHSVWIGGNNRVIISGGLMSSYVSAGYTSQVAISGGSMDHARAELWGRLYISGGNITEHLWVMDEGLITLEGAGFSVNGEGVSYYQRASDYAAPGGIDPLGNPCLTGWITGTLVSGDTLDGITFYILQDADITFVPPQPKTLVLLEPNGGENLNAGNKYTIKWSSSGPISKVFIEYSVDNGQDWNDVDVWWNIGSYDWDQVPLVDSNQCLVRISDALNPDVNDMSNTVFTIFQCRGPIAGDLNGDCYVDWKDFASFASTWLDCGNVFDPRCGVE
ncbi:MAG: hypothetical protein ACYS32_06950 [Planctomycetota bacterium]